MNSPTPRKASATLASLVSELRRNVLMVQAASTEAHAILDAIQHALDTGAHNMTPAERDEVQMMVTGTRAYLNNDEEGMRDFQ